MKPIELVRVGDVVRLVRRPVLVDPLVTYTQVGIRSFGKGVFHYAPVPGSELGKLRYFEVHPDELIISNIKGWEGAIAVTSEADTGCIASNRFLTYVPKNGQVDVRYLCYFFLTESGLELIRRASPGSTDRNLTLGIDAFEALKIPLPSLPQQEEVAQRIENVIDGSRTLSSTLTRTERLRQHLIDASVREILARGAASGWPQRCLDDVAMINPSPTRLGPDDVVTFVPMSAVDEITGKFKAPERRVVADLKSGYKQFRTGDVIFARITPCMQNGKSAVAEELPTEFGYGSTEFHVIRPGREVLAHWIHAIVRTRDFREKAAERFTGTAGQQRVPADFLRHVNIPIPTTAEEQRSTLREIDRLVQLGDRIRTLQLQQKARADALIPSFLNSELAAFI